MKRLNISLNEAFECMSEYKWLKQLSVLVLSYIDTLVIAVPSQLGIATIFHFYYFKPFKTEAVII